MTIRRNMAVVNHFTPTKTENGNRTIKLTNSAIEAKKGQMALTRMGKQITVNVHLREFGRIRKDDCTLVFSPRLAYPFVTEWAETGSRLVYSVGRGISHWKKRTYA